MVTRSVNTVTPSLAITSNTSVVAASGAVKLGFGVCEPINATGAPDSWVHWKLNG